jgi:thiosulfate/3-mercaptopyruvate sulfurtransferase
MKEDIHENGIDAKVKWVSTDWLEQNLENKEIDILDTQPNVHDYIAEHIPGAVYFNQNLLRIPYKGVPGVYIPEQAIELLFRRVGLISNKPVVIYTGKGVFKGWGDGLEQTMVAYSLAKYGHNNVYVLNGGLDKWKDEKKQLTKKFPKKDESKFMINTRVEYQVSMDELKKLKDNDDVILLDARPTKVYEGQGPWILPGHIPGAINLPWKNLMDDENPRLLKPDEKIQEILNGKNITRDKLIICSCGTGREATNEFLLFKWYLGYPNVKIYEGSFTEWTSFPENPTVLGKKPTLEPKEIVE